MRKNNGMDSQQSAVGSQQLAVLVIVCILFTACFQPESGCLDVEATNFELAADEPCDSDNSATSCPCTYPILSFDTMSYVVEKSDYQPNTFYRINSQFIQIQSIQFYLSGFQFRRTSGEWVGVADTISLAVLNEDNQLETQVFADDFVLVNQQPSIDMGAIKQHGTFDSLRFVLGIEAPANSTDPDSINRTSHALLESDLHTGDQATGYIFNQLIFFRDTLSSTAITLNITAADFAGQLDLMELKMPFSYETPIGKDFSLGTLQVDHAKWFDGINFVVDTEAIMIEKIVANTPNVFSVSN